MELETSKSLNRTCGYCGNSNERCNKKMGNVEQRFVDYIQKPLFLCQSCEKFLNQNLKVFDKFDKDVELAQLRNTNKSLSKMASIDLKAVIIGEPLFTCDDVKKLLFLYGIKIGEYNLESGISGIEKIKDDYNHF